MPSPFEWDEEKDRANRAKHGIGFEEATSIFTSPILTAPGRVNVAKSTCHDAPPAS